jgi:hypothetical protein
VVGAGVLEHFEAGRPRHWIRLDRDHTPAAATGMRAYRRKAGRPASMSRKTPCSCQEGSVQKRRDRLHLALAHH